MFPSVTLAARIEAAEAELTMQVGRAVARRDSATIVRALCGGAAVATSEGSPMDKVIGLGFAPFDVAAFTAFEDAVLGRAGSVQVELASLADPVIADSLGRRGYALVGFESVLGLSLPAAGLVGHPVSGTDDVEIAVAASTEIDEWIDVGVDAFAHPDVGDGPASHESFPRDIVSRAMRDMSASQGFTAYLARRDGRVVGAASMRIDGERRVAQLTGAGTLFAARRRGVQSMLSRARLAAAADAGAELAVVTTRPGSKSMENAMKSGFAHLYVRAVLVRAAARA
jgi:hypothetical protein